MFGGCCITDDAIGTTCPIQNDLNANTLTNVDSHENTTRNQFIIKEEKQKYVAPICPICFEETNLITLDCNHSYCNECLETYLQTKIEEGEYNILCPFDCCNVRILAAKISTILSASNFEEYEDLTRKQNQYDILICNHCGNRCKMNNSTVHCNRCNIEFCIICKSENCDGNCFDDTQRELNEIKEAFDNADVKKCPRCLMNLWKEKGCASVKCTRCKVRFCWECLLTESKLKNLNDHCCSTFEGYLDDNSDDYSDGEVID